jgi:hypothetical protein
VECQVPRVFTVVMGMFCNVLFHYCQVDFFLNFFLSVHSDMYLKKTFFCLSFSGQPNQGSIESQGNACNTFLLVVVVKNLLNFHFRFL